MSTQSDNIDELAKALIKAQASLRPAVKDSTNPHFKSKYADFGVVTDAARPVLAGNGLGYTQTFSESTGEIVTIITTLIHTSGQWMRSALTLKPTKPDPQGIGSAITYGRRYGLASILGIVADDDDDGNGASRTQEQKPASAKQTPVTAISSQSKEMLEAFRKGEAGEAATIRLLQHWKLVDFAELTEPEAKEAIAWIEAEIKRTAKPAPAAKK